MRRIQFRYITSHPNDRNSVAVDMQFTGLHDCNGNEIWEGDIVRHANAIREEEIDNSNCNDGDYCAVNGKILSEPYIRFGIVYWCEGDMGFAIDWNDNSCQFSDFTPGSYEVLGNIYQNEDMLEEIKQCEK